MKIRTGFVTNSSSTSFCIVGVYDEDFGSQLEERLQNLRELYQSKTGEKVDPEEFGDDWTYFLEKLFPQVSFYQYESDSGAWVGLDIELMKDNETLGEFKKRALKALKEVGLDITKVSIIMETIGG